MSKLGLAELLKSGAERTKVLVRVDYNVPQDEQGKITDDTRIRETVPTIRLLLDQGRIPILMSHLGRPKGKPEAKYSLKPVAEHLKNVFPGTRIHAADDVTGPSARKLAGEATRGSLVLLENLRFDPREEKNDAAFARDLASLGQAYVNDAFGASHRKHASVAAVPELFPGAAAMGLLMQKELDAYERILARPAHPFVAVLGGAKVSDKLGVVNHLLERCDAIIVGGAMAYTFLEAGGVAVGGSRVEADLIDSAKQALEKAKARNVEVLLPTDHVISRAIDDVASARDCDQAIPDGWLGLDIGPRTRERYTAAIKKAKTIAWNGPMGVFETERFAEGTQAVARAVAGSGAQTYAGGGDTVAAIAQFGLERGITHISTGGGASLELIEGRILPGIAALSEKR